VTYLEAFLPDGVLAWLRRIAENNLKDAIRKGERGKRLPTGKRAVTSGDSYVDLLEQIGLATPPPSREAGCHENAQIIENAR